MEKEILFSYASAPGTLLGTTPLQCQELYGVMDSKRERRLDGRNGE